MGSLSSQNRHPAPVAAGIAGRYSRVHPLDIHVLHLQAQLLGDNLHKHGIRALAAIRGPGQVIKASIFAQPHHRRTGLVTPLPGTAQIGCPRNPYTVSYGPVLFPRGPLLPLRSFRQNLQPFFETAGVHRDLIDRFVRGDNGVFQSDLHGIQAQFLGHHLHLNLGGKAGMGDSVAPHGC